MWNTTTQPLSLENLQSPSNHPPTQSTPASPPQPSLAAIHQQQPSLGSPKPHPTPIENQDAIQTQHPSTTDQLIQPSLSKPPSPDPQPDLPVPSSSDNNFFKQSPKLPIPGQNDNQLALAQAVDQLTSSTNGEPTSPPKSPSGSSTHSHSAVHPLLKQQTQTPFASTPLSKNDHTSPALDSPSAGASFDGVKFKTRSGGRPKDPVWVYFHTNGNGTDERATCKYCGWHVERPKAFRMRDHIAQCAQVDPTLRAEMSQLIAFKEAAAAAKQEEKAQLASSGANSNPDAPGSALKKRKVEPLVVSRPMLSFGKSPITSHVLDATSGKPGDEMGIRLDRLTSNGFVLIANGTTDQDGRCNTLLPGGSRPEVGIYKVTFFSNEFYHKRGIVSFYPFVEITFEVKDPSEHYHIPLLLSPYAFSTYRGS